jgi:DNA polymerase-3 subunit delta
VRESTAFVSGEKRADIVDAMFAAWADEKKNPAAERLLVLAALAGWNQEKLLSLDWDALSASDARALFGRELNDEEASVAAAIRAHADERGMAVAAYRDESALLEEFVAAGVPADTVLIFTAATVDRRKRLFKTLQERGTFAEFEVTRERSGALTTESVDQFVADALARAGKGATPGARRLITRRAGADPGALRMELEKLCLYVGDAAQIDEKDVIASFRDLAESWIFDFTRALSQGQAGAALSLLRGLFAQGEPPLRLLALIARELRMLLVARDCLADSLRSAWTARLPFAQFRDRVLPALRDDEREAFAGAHPFAIYLSLQNAARASTRGLQRALLELQEIDVALKSTRTDPQMRLEAFVLTLCAAFRAG